MDQSKQAGGPGGAGGIFDKKPQQTVPEPEVKKENFKDPFEEQGAMIKETKSKIKSDQKDYTETMADNINKAGKDIFDDDIEPISPEDLKLAEKLIFDGFAETDVSPANFPEQKFTICSSSAEEVGIVEEILFDELKSKERPDGSYNVSSNFITALRNALTIAISYRGRNKTELCPNKINHLNTIKRAIIRILELETSGDINALGALKTETKKSLLNRAMEVKKLQTAIIDFLSSQKYKFDKKMYQIMTKENVVPKS